MMNVLRLFAANKVKIALYAIVGILAFVASVYIHKPATLPDKKMGSVEKVETAQVVDEEDDIQEADEDEEDDFESDDWDDGNEDDYLDDDKIE